MKLDIKTCLRAGITIFLLYLCIHYWPAVAGAAGTVLGAVSYTHLDCGEQGEGFRLSGLPGGTGPLSGYSFSGTCREYAGNAAVGEDAAWHGKSGRISGASEDIREISPGRADCASPGAEGLL